VVYHLDLTPYDKWQIYSSKNSPIRVKAIALQLANYRFITSYNDIKLYNHDIITNTTTNELNVKILQLFETGFV
jgi:hypothetical protein